MDVIAMITAVGNATAKLAAEAQQHEALNNSPEMQKAHVLAGLQALIDQHRKEISDENLEAYRIATASTPTQS